MIIAECHTNVREVTFYWKGSGNLNEEHELVAVRITHHDGENFVTLISKDENVLIRIEKPDQHEHF